MSDRDRMTAAGWANKQAGSRARQRARGRMSRVFTAEYRKLLAELEEDSYYTRRERAYRKLAATHTRTYRHVLAEELAKENFVPLPLGRPRKSACGTDAGAAVHYRQGEKPCDPCRKAHNKTVAQNKAKRKALV